MREDVRTWRRIMLRIPGSDPEPLICALHAIGTLGTETRDDRLVAWFPDAPVVPDLHERLWAALGGNPAPLVISDESVADDRWHERWMEDLAPFMLGRRFIVVPGEDRRVPDTAHRIPLRVTPGRAFGTGEHATTRLCFGLLEESVTPGASVLDAGTGSGILAIAASLLGARPVVAVDVDPEAVFVARRNALLSGAPGVQFAVTPVEALRTGPATRFDVVMGNLDALTLVGAMPRLGEFVAGCLIVSGLLETDVEGVSRAAVARGLRPGSRACREGWAALRFTRA